MVTAIVPHKTRHRSMAGSTDENSTNLVSRPATISAQGASGVAVLIDMASQAMQFSVSLGFALLLSGTICAGLMTAAHQFSKTVRSSRQAVQMTSVRTLMNRLQAVAHDPSTQQLRDQFVRDIETARRQLDVQKLGAVSRQIQSLLDASNECYEVHLVGDAEELRGFTRDESNEFGLPERACYVIVEARDSFGRVLSRPARTATTSGNVPAVRWAERVPDAIYDRVLSAGKNDPSDNPSLFAIKERGRQTLVMRMSGLDGQPLTRQSQLTEW